MENQTAAKRDGLVILIADLHCPQLTALALGPEKDAIRSH
jgi:hypothetical protein